MKRKAQTHGYCIHSAQIRIYAHIYILIGSIKCLDALGFNLLRRPFYAKLFIANF